MLEPLFSNNYCSSFNRSNLELVTESIERITPKGVRTEDGIEREADLLILATGFAAIQYLSAIAVRGRDGPRIDDTWSHRVVAYLGATTSGFPRLFILYEPNMKTARS